MVKIAHTRSQKTQERHCTTGIRSPLSQKRKHSYLDHYRSQSDSSGQTPVKWVSRIDLTNHL
jgi:hypothetical protein